MFDYPSDFGFFAERKLSQPFSHLTVATIQLLVEVWDTLSDICSLLDYFLTYNGFQIENMDETH